MLLNRSALQAIRERSGLTRAALADAAKVDRSLIHRLETGERNASPTVIAKLAAALHVPVTALLGPADELAA